MSRTWLGGCRSIRIEKLEVTKDISIKCLGCKRMCVEMDSQRGLKREFVSQEMVVVRCGVIAREPELDATQRCSLFDPQNGVKGTEPDVIGERVVSDEVFEYNRLQDAALEQAKEFIEKESADKEAKIESQYGDDYGVFG